MESWPEAQIDVKNEIFNNFEGAFIIKVSNFSWAGQFRNNDRTIDDFSAY